MTSIHWRNTWIHLNSALLLAVSVFSESLATIARPYNITLLPTNRQLIYDVWNVQIYSWQPPFSFVFFQSVLASWRFYLNSYSIPFELIRYFFRDRSHLFQQGLRFLTPSIRGSNSNFLIFRTSPLTIIWYKRIISGKRRIHMLSSWKRKLHSGTNF